MSPRVPLKRKLLFAALALLILSPINILGDIPFLGMFDDIALLGFLANWFVRTNPLDEPPSRAGDVVATQ